MRCIPLAGFATMVALAATSPVAAQLSVELVQVPEQVSGSLDHGRNLLVTAEVHGKDVVEVWLATDADDAKESDRAPLTRAGLDRWQINLADGRAAALLGRQGKGSVAVHARTADGRVASSEPIRFDVSKTSEWPREVINVVATVDGERRVFRSFDDEEPWLVPEDVNRLEVRLRSSDRSMHVEATAKDRSWRLERDDDRTATLQITGEIADTWRAGKALTLRVGDDCRIRLRAIPRELAVGERHHFTLHQRDEMQLPGSAGALVVALGDITAGQVRVDIRTAKDSREIASSSLRDGGRLRFHYQDHSYVVEVDQLINYLIGDDCAKLVVWRPAEGEQDGSR